MYILLDLIKSYNIPILIVNIISIVIFFLINRITFSNNKTKIIANIAWFLCTCLTIIIFCCFNKIIAIKEILFVLCLCSFIYVCYCDIKTGEIAIKWLLLPVAFIFIINPLYNLFFGCSCLVKNTLIAFIIWLAIFIINTLINKENSIGGADIDILSALIVENFAIIRTIAMKVENPILLMSDYFQLLLISIFANFLIYLLIYVIICKIKKLNFKNGIRCLPMFSMLFLITTLVIFHNS